MRYLILALVQTLSEWCWSQRYASPPEDETFITVRIRHCYSTERCFEMIIYFDLYPHGMFCHTNLTVVISTGVFPRTLTLILSGKEKHTLFMIWHRVFDLISIHGWSSIPNERRWEWPMISILSLISLLRKAGTFSRSFAVTWRTFWELSHLFHFTFKIMHKKLWLYWPRFRDTSLRNLCCDSNAKENRICGAQNFLNIKKISRHNVPVTVENPQSSLKTAFIFQIHFAVKLF